MRNSLRYLQLLLLVICFVALISRLEIVAQTKPVGAGKSPLCSRDNALEMIKQQVGVSKSFNQSVRRITVLIRAGELLWPYQQARARAAFTEAFDPAKEHEKENEQKAPRSILLRLRVPDQRYAVIRAVARKDAGWAKELTSQMLKLQTEGDGSATRSAFDNQLTAERLLESANQLIATDVNAAFDLARMSLNYPASFMLPRFLYRLAGVNQQAADQFYEQALTVYAERPMREFLYLQAYPFAWRDTLNTPISSFFVVPANFVSNHSLQQRFVQVLLRRAQQSLDAPVDESDRYQTNHGVKMPGKVHLLAGLVRLEPQVRESLPELLPALIQAREKILVSLSTETQELLLQPGQEISSTPDKAFDEKLELAQKIDDVNERDNQLAIAVFGSEEEDLDKVIQAIDKISESQIRAHLVEWVYFHRARVAAEARQFEEAEKFAARVDGLEQRAYLHVEIAKALLKNSDTQAHGREVLDDAIAEAKKAGVTIFAARTLLTASTLYAKIDLSQSVSVLADAINCINRLDAPDFVGDGQALEKELERKGRGGRYQGEYIFHFYMPGLDPESAFREMAKIEFDTSLAQTSALTDKFQRAMSTLALAEVCLQSEKNFPRKDARTQGKP